MFKYKYTVYNTIENKPKVSTENNKEKVDKFSIKNGRQSLADQQGLLNNMFDKEIKDFSILKNKKALVLLQKLKDVSDSYCAKAKSKFKPGLTKKEFEQLKTQINEQLAKIKEKLKEIKELSWNAERYKEELKNDSELITLNLVKLYEGKNAKRNQIAYLAASYLIKWEQGYLKEMMKIDDPKKSIQALVQLRNKKGPAIKDLMEITKELNNILKKWTIKPTEEKNRSIYSDRYWDATYEQQMVSETGGSFWNFASTRRINNWSHEDYEKLEVSRKTQVKRMSATFAGMGAFGGAWLTAGTVGTVIGGIGGAVVGAVVGAAAGPSYKTVKTSEKDIKNYLKYARQQALKGKYPPQPDMVRTDGKRRRMKINPNSREKNE